MSETPTTIGIIGTGNIAHAHMRAYAADDRVCLAGMADADPERARRAHQRRRWEGQHGHTQTVAHLDQSSSSGSRKRRR